MVSPPRRQRARPPFPTSQITLAFDEFVDAAEFAGGRLQSISGEGEVTPEAFGMVADEVRDRLRRTPQGRRNIIALFCDYVQPLIQSGAVSPIGRRNLPPPRGRYIQLGIAAVSVACTVDRVRRRGGPRAVIEAAQTSARELFRELQNTPLLPVDLDLRTESEREGE